MEKLAYGLSLLTGVYIAFLYLTSRILLQDIFRSDVVFHLKLNSKKNKHQKAASDT